MSSSTPERGSSAAVQTRRGSQPARWILTAPAFATLLGSLGSDPDRAAEKYEALRHRIEKLFVWWGVGLHAPDLADQTLDRLARKLEEGAQVEEEKLGAYVRSVARLILHESLRAQEREQTAIRNSTQALPETSDREQAFRALDAGLDELDAADRRLLLAYYAGDSQNASTIEARKRLAEELGVTPLALRIRACRIRKRLEMRLR